VQGVFEKLGGGGQSEGGFIGGLGTARESCSEEEGKKILKDLGNLLSNTGPLRITRS